MKYNPFEIAVGNKILMLFRNHERYILIDCVIMFCQLNLFPDLTVNNRVIIICILSGNCSEVQIPTQYDTVAMI